MGFESNPNMFDYHVPILKEIELTGYLLCFRQLA